MISDFLAPHLAARDWAGAVRAAVQGVAANALPARPPRLVRACVLLAAAALATGAFLSARGISIHHIFCIFLIAAMLPQAVFRSIHSRVPIPEG